MKHIELKVRIWKSPEILSGLPSYMAGWIACSGQEKSKYKKL